MSAMQAAYWRSFSLVHARLTSFFPTAVPFMIQTEAIENDLGTMQVYDNKTKNGLQYFYLLSFIKSYSGRQDFEVSD